MRGQVWPGEGSAQEGQYSRKGSKGFQEEEKELLRGHAGVCGSNKAHELGGQKSSGSRGDKTDLPEVGPAGKHRASWGGQAGRRLGSTQPAGGAGVRPLPAGIWCQGKAW